MLARAVSKLRQWLDKVDVVIGVIAVVAIIGIALVTLIGIGFRLARMGSFGGYDMVEMMMVVALLLPLGTAQAEGGHIKTTLLTSQLRGRWSLGVT